MQKMYRAAKALPTLFRDNGLGRGQENNPIHFRVWGVENGNRSQVTTKVAA